MSRPIGVSLAAAWFFVQGALFAVGGIVSIVYVSQGGLAGTWGAAYAIAVGLVVLVLVILSFATGWGMWELRNWGRVTATVLAAVFVILDLLAGLNYVLAVAGGAMRLSDILVTLLVLLMEMVLNGLVFYYLLRPEVRDVFGVAAPLGVPYTPLVTPSLTPIESPSTEPQRSKPHGEPTKPVAVSPPLLAWMVVRTGPSQSGRRFDLTRGRNSIGRDATQCDIVLNDAAVSAEHAAIKYENGQFVLYDMASTNGTFVNQRKVQRQSLLDGDEVRMGDTFLVFKKA